MRKNISVDNFKKNYEDLNVKEKNSINKILPKMFYIYQSNPSEQNTPVPQKND